MNNEASLDRIDMVGWQRRSFQVGILAIVICILGLLQNPASFYRAYLTAYLFYLGLGLGSMILLVVYHLTGGSWGFLIRRILEAGMKTLPLMAMLFLPIAYGIKYIYLWAQPEVVAESPKLQYQQFYLAPVYFWIRAAVYFVLWLGIAYFLSSWSRQEDKTADPRLAWKSRRLSGPAAVIYGITIHFAAVDWAMSLEPVFHSTIFGPLFALGQLLSALALAIIVLACLVRRPPLTEVISSKVLGDLGSLLFTLLVLWAYLAWFQYMLVWIANMRVDVIWYLPRFRGGWLWVTWAIVLLHFVVPFFLLLMRSIKQDSRRLAWVAGLILFMQLVFMYYQIMPNFRGQTIGEHWIDFVMPLAVGGLWLTFFLDQLQKMPVLALNDYNRAAALKLRGIDEEEAAAEEEAFVYE